MAKPIKRLREMDDETLKQFCYDTFNRLFFEDFFDNMCYKHQRIWRMETIKLLKNADVTDREIDKFFN